MKREYNEMFDKLVPQKSDEELLWAVLLAKAEGSMTKSKFRFKPLIVAAAIIITSLVSLHTVNAATQGAVVKFFMGSEKIEGEYYDYVDGHGLWESYQDSIGGEFMLTGIAEGHPSGTGDKENSNKCTCDWENETKIFRESFY